jgi:hypothetical protein
MLPLPPMYLLNPAVGAAEFTNKLLLPERIVSPVLSLFLNIKFTLFVNEMKGVKMQM